MHNTLKQAQNNKLEIILLIIVGRDILLCDMSDLLPVPTQTGNVPHESDKIIPEHPERDTSKRFSHKENKSS